MPASTVSGPSIAAGESLSSVLNVSSGNAGIARITMPDQWDSAWLTFQISQDGAVFSDLHRPNGELVVVTVNPGVTIITDPDIWQAGYFKFRSGSPDSPVVQTDTRNFVCVLT